MKDIAAIELKGDNNLWHAGKRGKDTGEFKRPDELRMTTNEGDDLDGNL